jgi:hypothetical protein
LTFKNILRAEFKKTFRHSDIAFGSIDKNISGYASMSDFCQNLASKRSIEQFNIRFSMRGFKLYPKDLENFCVISGLFKDGSISQLAFKQTFFPYLCNNVASDDIISENALETDRNSIKERIMKID